MHTSLPLLYLCSLTIFPSWDKESLSWVIRNAQWISTAVPWEWYYAQESLFLGLIMEHQDLSLFHMYFWVILHRLPVYLSFKMVPYVLLFNLEWKGKIFLLRPVIKHWWCVCIACIPATTTHHLRRVVPYCPHSNSHRYQKRPGTWLDDFYFDKII